MTLIEDFSQKVAPFEPVTRDSRGSTSGVCGTMQGNSWALIPGHLAQLWEFDFGG